MSEIDNMIKSFFSDNPEDCKKVVRQITDALKPVEDVELKNKRIQKHLENKQKL